MDPNGGKKNMVNKFSKEQALKLLDDEKFNRITVSFYKYPLCSKLRWEFVLITL